MKRAPLATAPAGGEPAPAAGPPTAEGLGSGAGVRQGPVRVALGPEAAGLRLDRALAAALPALSRSRLQALIRDGRVAAEAGGALRDPSLALPAALVADGLPVVVDVPEPAPAAPRGEDIALSIVFEDDALVVVDKPAGLVVHPAPGHGEGTLVNALIAHCGASLSGIGGVRRPGIVHRLDKDTSGLLVVAKTDAAHKGLAAQFADHGRSGPLEREYLALVWGEPTPHAGVVDAALDRSSQNREKRAVVPDGRGRHAVTRYAVEEVYRDGGASEGRRREMRADGARNPGLASRVSCRLETGRTHQIRVHLAHLGHPLMGDALYGAGFRTKAAKLSGAASAALERLGRQALHAGLLAFAHPLTGRTLRFTSPPPPDMAALIAALGDARKPPIRSRL